MIELFTANTPNGKKISIMLEEIGYEYKVNSIDLNKGEQFNPEFKKISPFSKIPVINLGLSLYILLKKAENTLMIKILLHNG